MSPQKKVKTSQTAPTSSESTKIFEKRTTGATRYWLPHESPYFTKSSMSSKDWDKAFEMLKTMLADK